MALKKKKIEFYKLSLRNMDGSENELSFEDIITSNKLLNKEVYLKGKDLELKIYSKPSDNYVVGIIETTRKNNIPPKKGRKAKTLSKLGLNPDEGLAYGNVFLYDKKSKILMYEVNKFGCYLDHFISFIYLALKDTKLFKKFKIKLDVVLTKNEYNRIINMEFHKSVEFQIANPDKIIEEYKHKNGPLFNVCKSGNEFDSSRVFAKFEVESRKNHKSLTTKTVKEVLNDATKLLTSKFSGDVQKVIVSGYEKDIKKLQKIDLIADRYIKDITLDEPRENNDLLEKQRTSAIKELYENCIDELNEMFE